jgi:hypothetical protein
MTQEEKAKFDSLCQQIAVEKILRYSTNCWSGSTTCSNGKSKGWNNPNQGQTNLGLENKGVLFHSTRSADHFTVSIKALVRSAAKRCGAYTLLAFSARTWL